MKRSKRRPVVDNVNANITPNQYTIPSQCKKNGSMLWELRRYSLQDCEFCEKRFQNRYDMLIHNSTHIIIPLMKSIPNNCITCGRYCISQEHLEHHMSVKHKELVNGRNVNNAIKRETHRDKVDVLDTKEGEIESDEYFTDGDETLDNLIKKEQLGCGTEGVLQNFVRNCKVDVEKFDPPWLNHVVDQTIDKSDINKCVGKKNTAAKFKTSSDVSESDDPIRLLVPKRDMNSDSCYYYNSIHYEDLSKPGIFHCKHCFKRFPNRYEVITHEIVHMDLSKVFSHRRRKKRHRAVSSKPINAETLCERTRELQVKNFTDEHRQDNKQAQIEYRFNCSNCNTSFNRREMLILHKEKCLESGMVMYLCDNCYGYLRTTKAMDYAIVSFENAAQKKRCQECRRYYNDLWTLMGTGDSKGVVHKQARVVPETQKPLRIADRIQFEDSIEGKRRRKRLLTNSARLKIIQKRLKLINKYSAL